MYFGFFGSRSYFGLSSTDPEIMFHLTSQSDTFPFTNGVPAVRAKNSGLKTFN